MLFPRAYKREKPDTSPYFYEPTGGNRWQRITYTDVFTTVVNAVNKNYKKL